jgi:phosphate ABC transporter substrate-binding protein, PhoT family (TC 3.A.1.7.1)
LRLNSLFVALYSKSIIYKFSRARGEIAEDMVGIRNSRIGMALNVMAVAMLVAGLLVGSAIGFGVGTVGGGGGERVVTVQRTVTVTAGGAATPVKLSGKIVIDGSSTVYPLTEAAAEEFMKLHRDVQITVGISGTGGGFKRFVIGETDINDASRPILKSEAETAAKHGIEWIEVPVAIDGLVVVCEPAEQLGRLHNDIGAEGDLEARQQNNQVEPDQTGVAGCAYQAVRSRTRLRHLRLLHGARGGQG